MSAVPVTPTVDGITYASLFAGIGGFDLGFDAAGMRCAWQSEIDPAACKVLAAHWPDVPNLGDVTRITDPPDVDVMCGGFPCQDLSVAGRRRGLAGERSGLFFVFMRLVRDKQPRVVVIENVPGLLSSKRGRDFGIVLDTLRDLGYRNIAWRVLDALNMGVPQRRRRVFIVAVRGDGTSAREALLEAHGRSWAEQRAGAPDDDIGGLFDLDDAGYNYRTFLPATTLDTWADGVNPPAVKWPKSGASNADGSWTSPNVGEAPFDADPVTLADILEPEPVGERYYLSAKACAGVLRRAANRGRALPPMLHAALWAVAAQGVAAGELDADALEDVDPPDEPVAGGPQPFRKVRNSQTGDSREDTWDNSGFANTLNVHDVGGEQRARDLVAEVAALTSSGVGTCGADDNQAQAGHLVPTHAKCLTTSNERIDYETETFVAHLVAGARVRRLTPLECERLQGFPDGWTEPAGSDSARYRGLGNAVATVCAAWLGRRIVDVIFAADADTEAA